MHVAHFIQRYPPALGGSEAYFARLTEYLRSAGDTVAVFTSTAVELGEMWSPRSSSNEEAASLSPSPLKREGRGGGDGERGELSVPTVPPTLTLPLQGGGDKTEEMRRYRPLTFPGRRYVLKALSMIPVRRSQALILPCNPVCPDMWRDAGTFDGPLDAVHATAFPYTFPIACGLRLARRRGVPFFLTPFLHLGDPADPNDRTRRQYTAPVMRWLLRQADGVFVQTEGERRAVVDLGVPDTRVIRQGLGVESAECTGGDRATARRAWGVRDNELVVGHLANLSVEKGTVDLLKANLDARVVLAGPAMPNFERFWPSRPNPDRVVRQGVLTDEAKRDFYAGIDVFCLPSRSDSFGLVLLEAWANAKPVVVYNAGGPAELVRRGIDGFVTDCDPVSLKTAMLKLEGLEPRTSMGHAGRERTETEFRWSDKLAIVRDALRNRRS
jgi:glycosyltransferase involved in cell wall biosynthesis